MTTPTETITLGGGCFWCTEAVFVRVAGVLDVESGYCNGNPAIRQPSYEQICTGQTGYAEVVKLVFDPAQVSLRELLEVFFVVHDPTTLNRQGNDTGTQYRSGIYWHDAAQERVARELIAELGAHHRAPIVTEVLPVADYSAAEAYHQDYFLNHPNQGYCAFVVAPKVDKFQRTFARLVRAD
ncbi:peptide-methionine (S)-S-oxide reductase MsrA [Hydrogenophaga sp. OTU3427]|uniref:peptide-methionine (S)-S-oxide reductase MsrA n=1 Tax=Hydrogenophaga sp. OTU3427 TaxID=3043856 RepID=UPI00313E71AA